MCRRGPGGCLWKTRLIGSGKLERPRAARSMPAPSATATRPRMARFTVRLPRKTLIDLEALAAADERPPAVVARVLQEAINANTAPHP